MAKKILLADDSLTIQKVVELTFSDSDYSLVCVSNGQLALDRVRSDRPDLILADVVMPEKNGYEVCEAIKGDPATARIPVVLLSGTFEPFDRARAERIGADAIVPKPFDSQQLLAQVEALIAKAPPAPDKDREPAAMPQTTAAIAIPPPTPARPPSGGMAGHATTGHSDEAPFDVGFSAEDFTAAVRLPAPRGGVDPFEEEYGRGDVESAIEAFEKAHPKFGLGSRLDSAPDLADAPLERGESGRNDRSESARNDASESVRDEPDEPKLREDDFSFRREEPARDPQWLRDEPEREKGLFAPLAEKPAAPLDFGSTSHEDAATVALRRSDFPVRADEMPTMEFPSYERRPSSKTEDPGLDSPRGWMDTAPASRPSTMEISAQDADALFEVGSPTSMHAGASANANANESSGASSDADADADADEGPSGGSKSPEPAGNDERTQRMALSGLAAVPPPVDMPMDPEPMPEEARETTPESVSGEIEMLAQRSSIPELTQMLSNVRNTGDGAAEMSDEQLDRLAARVVEKLSDRIVREIAWEVIPDMAEIVIKQRIKELESGAE